MLLGRICVCMCARVCECEIVHHHQTQRSPAPSYGGARARANVINRMCEQCIITCAQRVRIFHMCEFASACARSCDKCLLELTRSDGIERAVRTRRQKDANHSASLKCN